METPTPSLWQRALEVRILGIPLAGIIDAAPDFALAYAFLRGVMNPVSMGVAGVQWLGVVMMMEFIAVHSTVFVGSMVYVDAPRATRLKWALGFSLFYSLFVLGMSAGFHSWYPAIAFTGLTLNRVLGILLRNPRTVTAREGSNFQTQWVFGGVAYVLSMVIGALLCSLLGGRLWSPQVYDTYLVLHGDMSGTLDVPLLAGLVYFAAQGIRELFFMHDLGAPGYLRPTDEPMRGGVIFGIHNGLWYLLGRQAASMLFILGFLALMAYFDGGPVIIFGVVFMSVVGYAQVLNVRWLLRATRLLRHGPCYQMRLQMPEVKSGARSITTIEVYRDSDAQKPYRRLRIEFVRARNFLPPDATSLEGEVYISDNKQTPIVIRIGRTFLVQRFPTTPNN